MYFCFDCDIHEWDENKNESKNKMTSRFVYVLVTKDTNEFTGFVFESEADARKYMSMYSGYEVAKTYVTPAGALESKSSVSNYDVRPIIRDYDVKQFVSSYDFVPIIEFKTPQRYNRIKYYKW